MHVHVYVSYHVQVQHMDAVLSLFLNVIPFAYFPNLAMAHVLICVLCQLCFLNFYTQSQLLLSTLSH